MVLAHDLRPTSVTLKFTQQRVDLKIVASAEALMSIFGVQNDKTYDTSKRLLYKSFRDSTPELFLKDFASYAEVCQQYKTLRILTSEQLSQQFAVYAETYQQGLILSHSNQPLRWVYDRIDVPEVDDISVVRNSTIYYHADLPSKLGHFVWRSDPDYGDVLVSFMNPAGEKISHWLVGGQKSPVLDIQQESIKREWQSVFADYSELGFLHILPKGMDHILFVLGLFLLSRKVSPLLWQVTAFTLAHSITLALSVYGVLNLSASIVEPLIALSIAYVGFENLITRDLKPWRVLVVFLFGLLHGMGFAGVLFELGLPENEFITTLIAFNLGVEGGQLAVITLAFVTVFWLRRNDDLYRRLVVIPGSLIITCMGLFWVWQRVSF